MQVAAKIWPDVTFYVRRFLKEKLEPQIQSSLPSKLKSFAFDRIDLGDMVCRCCLIARHILTLKALAAGSLRHHGDYISVVIRTICYTVMQAVQH